MSDENKPSRPRVLYVYDVNGNVMQMVGPASVAMIETYESKKITFIVEERTDKKITDVYVDGGKLFEKSAMLIEISKNTIRADGVDTARITGIPEDARVSVGIPGQHTLVNPTDGAIDLTSDMPANYIIEVEAPRRLLFKAEIVAT